HTTLERPKELGTKAFLTDAEAAAFEKQTLAVQNRDRRDGEGPDGRGTDGRTDLDRAYGQAWWEYGSKLVGTRRTSLIVDPPDGRIPALTADGERRALDKRGLWTANGEYEGGARGRSLDSHADRPLHAPQSRDAGVRIHGRRSADVDQAVDGAVSDDADRRAGLRVRLPRGELQPAEHPRRREEDRSVERPF